MTDQILYLYKHNFQTKRVQMKYFKLHKVLGSRFIYSNPQILKCFVERYCVMKNYFTEASLDVGKLSANY